MVHNLLGDAVADGLIGETVGRKDLDDDSGIKRMSTTEWLARTHGITRKRIMYVYIRHLSRLTLQSVARPLRTTDGDLVTEADTDRSVGISRTISRSCNGSPNTNGHTFKGT